MLRFFTLIPAMLSFLMLGAHFHRAEQRGLVAASAVMIVLLFIRRWWSVLAVQWALLAGSGVWLWTMLQLVQMREQLGQPATRLAIILTSVAAWTFLSALLLEIPRLRRRFWFGRRGDAGVGWVSTHR